MQYRVPREVLQEIQARISLVEVIGRYVSLQKRGRSYVGLCPFHGEKTPSFHVDETKRMFYCFGCQAGGDVFKFLTLIENEGFMEVVRELAVKAGIQLPERELSPEEKRVLSEREHLFHLHEVAAGFFERNLLGAVGVRPGSYLQKRGLPAETTKTFRLGYAPEGWQNLADFLRQNNHPPHLAEKAGLIIPGQNGRHYDRFRDRVMFPIRNVTGKIIAFGGRILDQGEPKYLNSPESPLFNKSEALYGIDLARRAIGQEDCVIVVEGYFDTLGLHAAGIHNVVATCGTSLTRSHLRFLKRYTQRVILMYDGDKAGLKAAERSLSMFLDEELWPYFIPLPQGLDPDDVVKAEGGEAFRQRIQRAIPLLDHVIMRQARVAQSSADDKDRALDDIAPLFPLLTRLKPQKADFYISFIAQHFGILEPIVQNQLRQVLQASHSNKLERPGTLQPPVRKAPVAVLPPHEEFLVHWIVQRPDEILPAAIDAHILDWLTHAGLKQVVGDAIARFQAGTPVEAAELIAGVSDTALQTKLAELCVKELELQDQDREKAMVQSLLGIKEKNIHSLLRHVQGEIARMGREGGDSRQLNQLLMQKVELNREKDSLRRRSGSGI